MKKISILYFIFCWFRIFAQGEYFGAFSFQKGTEQVIAVESVKIREMPNIISKEIDILHLIDRVKILETTTHIFTLNGKEAPWYKVLYKKDGAVRVGYIWGGNLALNYQKKDGVEFILGAEGVSKKKSSGEIYQQLKMRVIAVKNNKILDSRIFTIDELHFPNLEIENNKGLVGIKNIVIASNIGGACGIATITQYLLWTGEKFFPLGLLTNVGDAGIFSHTEEYIFPADKGGKKGKILMKMEEVESNENGKIISKKTNQEVFLWEKGSLSKQLKFK